MAIKTFYTQTSFEQTYQEFIQLIEKMNEDGRRKKATASNTICDLIEKYVKTHKAPEIKEVKEGETNEPTL